jgi:hypothetical protein
LKKKEVEGLKRLILVITVVALIAALMAPPVQAQQQSGYWYWCWNSWSWSWDSCWWDGVGQTSGQDVTSGIATQTISVGPNP